MCILRLQNKYIDKTNTIPAERVKYVSELVKGKYKSKINLLDNINQETIISPIKKSLNNAILEDFELQIILPSSKF